VIRSESALKLYVDGREDASEAFVTTRQIPDPAWDERSLRLDAGVQLRLGAGIDGLAPFHGLIDEVLFFRQALSGEDLRRVMQATSLDRR
jgi:hypothetical protein